MILKWRQRNPEYGPTVLRGYIGRILAYTITVPTSGSHSFMLRSMLVNDVPLYGETQSSLQQAARDRAAEFITELEAVL